MFCAGFTGIRIPSNVVHKKRRWIPTGEKGVVRMKSKKMCTHSYIIGYRICNRKYRKY